MTSEKQGKRSDTSQTFSTDYVTCRQMHYCSVLVEDLGLSASLLPGKLARADYSASCVLHAVTWLVASLLSYTTQTQETCSHKITSQSQASCRRHVENKSLLTYPTVPWHPAPNLSLPPSESWDAVAESQEA